jgi:multiple antibiotic resistance protein
MDSWWESFVLTFIPLFIVIDAIGNLPFLISLTEGMSHHDRYRVIHIASATAALIGLIFLFFGHFVLNIMGITVGAFSIAGGLILLVLSVRYMTSGRMVETIKEEMVAVVPIGTPLTVGPATITTLLLLVNQYKFYIVLISFMVNVLLTWIIFMLSNQLAGFMGQGGLKAISRVFSLLLAAIAVNMVIQGLSSLGIINTAG